MSESISSENPILMVSGRRPAKHAWTDFPLGYRRYWRHWRRDKNPSEIRPPDPSKSAANPGLPEPVSAVLKDTPENHKDGSA